jgi:eukaryotic-like serine/threonine-protein kinase
MFLAGLTLGGYCFLRHTRALTEKDTLVVSDVINATGDPVFDGALRQGLTVQLEQSPFLSLVSEARIQGTLPLMGQPSDTQLTPKIARDLCQWVGSVAVINGSIASLGRQYVLDLKAFECKTVRSIAANLFSGTSIAGCAPNWVLPRPSPPPRTNWRASSITW